MKRIVIVVCMALLLAILWSCTVDVDELKANGPKYFEGMGYKVLGYEGYQWDVWGGRVWFFVQDKETGLKYSHFLIKRGNEYHWYYGNDHQQALVKIETK